STAQACDLTNPAGPLCAANPWRRVVCSAERWRVVQAALHREIVEPPLEFEGRLLPKVALEYLAIVADLAHDALRPVGAETQPAADVGVHAQEGAPLRARRRLHCVDVGAVDAELFCSDERVERPAHDTEPNLIPLPHRRPHQVSGGDLGEDHLLAR